MNYTKLCLLLMLLIGISSCEPYVEDKMDLDPLPTPSFEIIQGASPNDFTLKNTTPGAFLTNWDLGDLGNQTGEEVEVTYPFMGTYEVTMSTFNSGGSASTTKSVTVTEDDPNACFGNFEILTGCDERVWRLADEEGAINVGPSLTESYWGNSTADIAERVCHWDDQYIFRANGEYEYNNNGDFWADSDADGNVSPPELAVAVGCHPNSVWPEAFQAWDSGVHAFSVTTNTLTVAGEGAWIGLYKIGTAAEVTVPQQSVSFGISEISDNRVVLFTDYGGLVWRVTLVSD